MSDSGATAWRIADPHYVIEPADAALLASRTHQELVLRKTFTKAQTKERIDVSKRIGESAALRLLASLSPEWHAIDANEIVSNNPGYDIAVYWAGTPGRHLRISVKSCTYIAMTQWHAPTNLSRKAWDYDALILVDAGVTMDSLGLIPDLEIPRQPDVAFYIFSKDEVLSEFAHAKRNETAKGFYICRFRTPQNPKTLDARHQVRDLERYRSRFDTIERMLSELHRGI